MRASLALLTGAAALVAAADVANYTSELDMTIDPNSVTQSERSTWCQAQINTCNLLCSDETNLNSCTQSTLNWTCTCSSNNSEPGLQYYTQTLPTFICNELYSQCIDDNVGDSTGQDECTTNIQDLCGTVDPPSGDTTSTAASTTKAAATKSSSGTTAAGTASATGESVSTTTSGGFAGPTLIPGSAAIAIGVLAYFV